MPFVVTLNGSTNVLLLAEEGLLEEDPNIAFDESGRVTRHDLVRFDRDSEREVESWSPDASDAQWQAYVEYWERMDRDLDDPEDKLRRRAARHPVRHGVERFGGVFLPHGQYAWADAVARLDAWLREAVREDVIGSIGTYAGQTWISTSVPALDGGTISIDIHSDTKAAGVAEFLIFVLKNGGPEGVRGTILNGQRTLVSADGTRVFDASYFYISRHT